MGGYHGNGTSQIFIQLKQFSTYLGFFILCICSQLAYADIGETYSLKQERKLLILEIRNLKKDTLSAKNAVIIDSLTERILNLDSQIFDSYDESISRISAQNLEQGNNDKLSVYLALGTTTIALIFASLLLMARSRIQSNGTKGLRELYRQLTTDFISSVSPEKALTQRLLRVNVVVIVGLTMMSLSIIAYLMSGL